jgi:hypothetical protein
VQTKEGKRELLGEGENEREDELVMETVGVAEEELLIAIAAHKEPNNRQLGVGVVETTAAHLSIDCGHKGLV